MHLVTIVSREVWDTYIIARNVQLPFFLDSEAGSEPRFSRHPWNDRQHEQVRLSYKLKVQWSVESYFARA
jgi:hypothetical protein